MHTPEQRIVPAVHPPVRIRVCLQRDGEESSAMTQMLERMQSLIDAGINKSQTLSRMGKDVNPYIKREITKSYIHLKEAYLRMMDM